MPGDGLGAGRAGAAAGLGAAGAAGLGAAGAAGLGAAGAAAGFAAAGFRAEDFRAAARLGAARLGAARLAFLAVALRAGFLALTDLPRRAAPARRAAVLAPALRLVAERFPAFFLVLVVFDFDFRAALAITSSCFCWSGFITRGAACGIVSADPPTHARFMRPNASVRLILSASASVARPAVAVRPSPSRAAPRYGRSGSRLPIRAASYNRDCQQQ